MIQNPNTPSIDGMTIDPAVVKVMKAIRQVESAGAADPYSVRGDNGAAYGAFQYNEQTGPGWKNIAKQYLGDENAPMDKANQNKATYKRIKEWKDQGLDPEEIAARWNGAYKDAQGKYRYNNPEYGEKFRAALLGGGAQVGQYKPPAAPQPFTPQEPSTLTAKPEDKSFGRKAAEFMFPILEEKERTGLQTAADVALSAASLFPVGKGAQLLSKLPRGVQALKSIIPGLVKHGTLAKGVGAGYGVDVLSNLSQGDTGTEALTPGFGTAVGTFAPVLSRFAAGTKLGKKALDEDALDKAVDIVAPTMTKKNIREGLKQGLASKTGRLAGRIGLEADPKTIRAANGIKDLVKNGVIKTSDTVETKVNAVRDEIEDVAETLEDQLKKMEIQPILAPDELGALLQKTQQNFKESPILVGDAGVAAERIFDKFVSFLPKGKDVTAYDLLKARKRLDRWIKREGRGAAFDPRVENAISKGLREIRQGANDLVIQKAPDVAVKEMLQKQSAMYDALDAIIENSWRDVGTSRTGRYFKNHPYQKGLINMVGTGLVGGAVTGTVMDKLSD